MYFLVFITSLGPFCGPNGVGFHLGSWLVLWWRCECRLNRFKMYIMNISQCSVLNKDGCVFCFFNCPTMSLSVKWRMFQTYCATSWIFLVFPSGSAEHVWSNSRGSFFFVVLLFPKHSGDAADSSCYAALTYGFCVAGGIVRGLKRQRVLPEVICNIDELEERKKNKKKQQQMYIPVASGTLEVQKRDT